MVHVGNAAGEFRRIPLAGRNGRGRHVVVDASDHEHLRDHRWWLQTCRGRPGYAYARVEGRKVALHRLLLGLAVGDPRQVDHINGDTLDCRRANLRLATPAQNRANSDAQFGDSSPYKGVFRRPCGRYQAQIAAEGNRRCLGTYDDAERAARAYDAAAVELHGPFARTNADAGLLEAVPA